MDEKQNDDTKQPAGQLADAEVEQERPRERLATVGAQQLSDAELLALVLGWASTDESAALLAQLGGLRGLAQADEQEIRDGSRGIGAVKATMIRAALELGRRAIGERPTRGARLASATAVWAHMQAKLALLPVEEFWSISLDVRHRVLTERCVARGSLTGVDVHPRDVFRPLIRESAAAVIFCHNHPSGDPSPSRQDVELTARLREVGELCGITVLDHVVVATEGYVSLADRGWVA